MTSVFSVEQLVFVTGLVMGTASTLLIKATYDHGAVDPITGANIPFEKPIFMTFIMFLGMFFALPLYLYLNRNVSKQLKEDDGSNAEKQSLLSNDSPKTYTHGQLQPPAVAEEDEETLKKEEPFNIWSFKLLMILMIPSIFDMLGTILSTIGLLYVSVSLYQLSRCCVIIVTAIFKRVILNHKLTTANYAGVIINTLAMLLVGGAAIMLEQPPTAEELAKLSQMAAADSSRTTTGLIFIIASCVVQGAQYVFEEKVMSFDNVPPLVLIGFEGLNGVLLSLFVAFPFAMLKSGPDNGMYEDIWAAFTLPLYSTGLMVLLVAFFLIIFLYNIFCVYITFLLSSIYHCIMDGLRPCAVWLTSLASFYVLGWSGQPWSTLCWFELTSMILIFYGTAVYSGQVKLPCVKESFDGKEGENIDEINAIPIRDTPVFSARVNHHHHHEGSTDPVGLLTQSPNFRAQHHPHSAQPQTQQRNGMPLAQQSHPSSRATTSRDVEQAMM